MTKDVSIDRGWIAQQLVKWLASERSLASGARGRADSPPEPSLGVLYGEIAKADERHAAVLERVAVRYGHELDQGGAGGLGEALGQLKTKVAELASAPSDQVAADLEAKSRTVQWSTALVEALGSLGEKESSVELGEILREEQAHCEALQKALNRCVEQQALGASAAAGAA